MAADVNARREETKTQNRGKAMLWCLWRYLFCQGLPGLLLYGHADLELFLHVTQEHDAFFFKQVSGDSRGAHGDGSGADRGDDALQHLPCCVAGNSVAVDLQAQS